MDLQNLFQNLGYACLGSSTLLAVVLVIGGFWTLVQAIKAKWFWRGIWITILLICLAAGGITGEEVIPIVALLLGEVARPMLTDGKK